MLSQYPNTISIELNATSPSLEDGEWAFGTSTTVEFKCRGELNKSGRVIGGASGQAIVFDYTVYMPKISQEFPIGSKVVLKLSDTRKIESTIKNQENGQLNTRIWL